jgi:hypothetical protein
MVRWVAAAIAGAVSDVPALLGMGVREPPVTPKRLFWLVRTRARTTGGGGRVGSVAQPSERSAASTPEADADWPRPVH